MRVFVLGAARGAPRLEAPAAARDLVRQPGGRLEPGHERSCDQGRTRAAMMRARVRFTMIPEVLADIYPSGAGQ